jgi:hypothetical protein
MHSMLHYPDLAKHLIVLGHGLLASTLATLGSGLGLLGLGDKHGGDVGENTTLGNGDTAEQLVQLLIVADGELDVAGHNAGLLVISGGIASKLKDLSGKVLKDGSKVHRGTGTNAGGVLALLQKAGDTADGELESGLGTLGLTLLGAGLSATSLASLSTCSSFSTHY